MGRPKLDRVVLQVRVAANTPETLKKMALKLGYQWGAEGNTGKLLDAIASLPTEEVKKILQDHQRLEIRS
ncbi:MAG: hypothetical protein QNJ34_12465 [Xenococcaceae cyanobacterium MO_188.B29]|nr:hypothetical protein [Xenococcaceae cyanobacterium MO_188.B29]